ncbi:hypothetical protein BJ978_003206 [Agromyces terreus]|uniref:Uncharacterized protein n=1 Tax=Agromyces terreus TaxID=424795 RepID=A0A9X2H4A5_9MICO|nr:hypothetical protein [Agromyces terreus]MCP2372530.1 hypothetical protein [Agromyces terreus]
MKLAFSSRGAAPRVVETAANVLVVGGASALVYALIVLAFLVPSLGDSNAALALAAGATAFAAWCGAVAIVSGIHARRGREWPRFVATLIAITLAVAVRDQWFILIALALVSVGAVLLWLPTARAYAGTGRRMKRIKED